MGLTNSQVTRLLREEKIFDRVKLENYLLVALGVRKSSLTVFPAELFDGASIGATVDQIFLERYTGDDRRSKLGLVGLFGGLKAACERAVKGPLGYKAGLIRKIFERVLAESPSYKVHKVWAKELGLKTYEVELRPTVREFYLYRDHEFLKLLRMVQHRRQAVWEEVRQGWRQPVLGMGQLFPEERDREFLEMLGSLLGHPSCCVGQYIADRISGEIAPELRASNQIKEYKREGKHIEAHAYYVKDFFPCHPNCQRAANLGRRAHQALEGLDPRLGGLYVQVLEENVALVENYPELIDEHYRRLREKSDLFQAGRSRLSRD
ncbi:MAG: hypothetical protein M1553_08280 [Firmicutes bacterium]|nr:hypothetical protein [Bacillota bacterium]